MVFQLCVMTQPDAAAGRKINYSLISASLGPALSPRVNGTREVDPSPREIDEVEGSCMRMNVHIASLPLYSFVLDTSYLFLRKVNFG